MYIFLLYAVKLASEFVLTAIQIRRTVFTQSPSCKGKVPGLAALIYSPFASTPPFYTFTPRGRTRMILVGLEVLGEVFGLHGAPNGVFSEAHFSRGS